MKAMKDEKKGKNKPADWKENTWRNLWNIKTISNNEETTKNEKNNKREKIKKKESLKESGLNY